MDCEKLKDSAHEYIKGLLPSATKKEFDSHVNTCQECRSYINSAAIILSGLAASEPGPEMVFNQKRFPRILSFMRRIAVPAIAAAALFMLMLVPYETSETESNAFSESFTITLTGSDAPENGHILEDLTILI